MSDYNNLEAKLEAIFRNVLVAAIPAGLNHFTGLTDQLLQLPKSVCFCPTSAEVVIGSSVHRAQMQIQVESLGLDENNAADSGAVLSAHQTRVAQVRDAIMRDDIIAVLNQAAIDLAIEVTVIDLLNPSLVEDTESFNLRNALNLEVIAANARI